MGSSIQSSSPAPAHRLRGRPRSSSTTGLNGLNSDELQPWTAARCHRLLRQLQSRLASLRRLISEDRLASSTASKRLSDDEPRSTSKRVRLTYGQKAKQPASEPHDSATKTPPRAVRTLGAMRLGNSSPASGPVDFRTPVWRKIREQTDTPRTISKFKPLEDDLPTALPPGMTEEMHSLRQLVPNGQYRIYEATFDWLRGLLRSTTPRAQQIHPKSLFAMCLRKVPACIADIEAWERRDSKDKGTQTIWSSSSVALDLYDQLEAFGPGNAGWRPLGLVVRSQAISLLSDAISEGLFQPAFGNLLIRLCGHLKCNEEAAILTSSMQVMLPGPRSAKSHFSENKQLRPLCALLEPLGRKRIPGPIFDCISTLFEEGHLPLAWLSTRGFSSLWASSLEVMTLSKSRLSVLGFMCTTMLLLARGDRNKQAVEQCNAEQTLIGVAAGVTAAALALESDASLGEGGRREKAWRRLIYVLEYTAVQVRRCRSRKRGHDNSLFILALARYLAVAESRLAHISFTRQAAEELEDLAARIDASAKDTQYRQMILLICAITQCRRRSCTATGPDGLADICTKLEGLNLPDWFGEGLQKDVAFMLAQKTKDLRDLAFAESLPLAANSAGISTMFSGWRWEEGISEWVLPSPEAKVRRGCTFVPGTETATTSPEGYEHQGSRGEGRMIRSRSKSRSQSINGVMLATRTTTMGLKAAGQSGCVWNATKHGTTKTKVLPGKGGSRRLSMPQRVRPALATLSQPRNSKKEYWDDLI